MSILSKLLLIGFVLGCGGRLPGQATVSFSDLSQSSSRHPVGVYALEAPVRVFGLSVDRLVVTDSGVRLVSSEKEGNSAPPATGFQLVKTAPSYERLWAAKAVRDVIEAAAGRSPAMENSWAALDLLPTRTMLSAEKGAILDFAVCHITKEGITFLHIACGVGGNREDQVENRPVSSLNIQAKRVPLSGADLIEGSGVDLHLPAP